MTSRDGSLVGALAARRRGVLRAPMASCAACDRGGNPSTGEQTTVAARGRAPAKPRQAPARGGPWNGLATQGSRWQVAARVPPAATVVCRLLTTKKEEHWSRSARPVTFRRKYDWSACCRRTALAMTRTPIAQIGIGYSQYIRGLDFAVLYVIIFLS